VATGLFDHVGPPNFTLPLVWRHEGSKSPSHQADSAAAAIACLESPSGRGVRALAAEAEWEDDLVDPQPR
jgi:hypothetical protein